MDILSPAVVTTEKDLSYVAPAISSSIAAIVGAAKKGPVNIPTYITSPTRYLEVFGEPILENFGGQASMLYLQQANMLWYNRVASQKGSDPIATANTDTRAVLTQTDATAFLVPSDMNNLVNTHLRLRFDNDSSKDITISFTSAVIVSIIRATLVDTMTAFVNFVNNMLSGNNTFEPRYGYAEVISASPSGKKIKINTQSKIGTFSHIAVMPPASGTDAASKFGWTSGITTAIGTRTVYTSTSMTEAQITSAAIGVTGYWNLGTPASATCGNNDPWNLGESAAAEIVDIASGLWGATAYGFVAAAETKKMTDMQIMAVSSDPSSVLAYLQANYGFDPVATLVIDGYTINVTFPIGDGVTTMVPGAITVSDLNNIASAINAACPAGLGDVAHVRAIGGGDYRIIIQSKGKTSDYSYITASEPSDSSPSGSDNRAAVMLYASYFLGIISGTWGWGAGTKAANVMTVTRDDDVYTVRFDAASLATQGLNPMSLTPSQVIQVANYQTGENMITNPSDLNLEVVNDYPGIYGFTKIDFLNSFHLVGPNTSSGLGKAAVAPSGIQIYPDTSDHISAAWVNFNEVREPGAIVVADSYHALYVKFSFNSGQDWAWVRIDSLQKSVRPWNLTGLTVTFISSSILTTPAQEALFVGAGATGLKHTDAIYHNVTYTYGSNGFQAVSDANWNAAVAVGDLVTWATGSGRIINGSGVAPMNRQTLTGWAGWATINGGKDLYQTTIQLISGVAPIPGVTLTSGVHTLVVRNVFLADELQIYFNNTIELAGQKPDGIFETYFLSEPATPGSASLTIGANPGVPNQVTLDTAVPGVVDICSASECGAPVATNKHYLNSENSQFYAWTLSVVVECTKGPDTKYGAFIVIPSSGVQGDSLSFETFSTPAHSQVELLTTCPIEGETFSCTSANSYAYIATQSALAGPLVTDRDVVFMLKAVVIGGGWAVTGILSCYVFLAPNMSELYIGSSTPSATRGMATTSATTFNPSTGTFQTTACFQTTTDDYGEGWNKFAFVADNTWSVNVDFNDYSLFVDRANATCEEVSMAINDRAKMVDPSLDGIASGASSKVSLVSKTKGASSKLQVTVDNAPMNWATYLTPVYGSGSQYFSLAIDADLQVDIDFTDYVGDLIANQSSATPSEVIAVLKRACNLDDTHCLLVGSGPATQVKVFSTVRGPSGQIVVVTGNSSMNGDFNSTGTYYGTETKIPSTTIYAVSPGTWANPDDEHIKIRFTDEDSLFYAPNTSMVEVLENGIVVETYREVSPNPSANGTSGTAGQGYFIESIIGNLTKVANGTNPSQYIAVEYDEDVTTPEEEYTGGKFAETAVGSEYEIDGGANGLEALNAYDFIGVAYSNLYARPTGLQAWRDNDARFINLMIVPGITYPSVIREELTICEARGDCMCIIDPPIGLTPEQVVDWHNGRGYGNTAAFNSSYGALYNTWILYADPYNQTDVWLPPTCFVLATYAYSDKISEPWFAPAGLVRGKVQGALDLMHTPDFGQRNLMYGQGNAVNSIVNFSQDGIVIWGQRTLQRAASTLDRVNVRRLMLYLRTTCALAAKIFLFDPNDETERKLVVNALETVATDVIRRRGVVRAKVVDKTTSTDINNKRMRIAFFLEPTQSAEVIEIPFILAGSGQAFIDTAV